MDGVLFQAIMRCSFCHCRGLFFVSRLVGILGCCWVLLVICLPRLYLGFHYATDILAGAAIGLAIAWIASTPVVRDRVSRWPMDRLRRHCGSFYAVAFLLSWQIATLFNDIRELEKACSWRSFPSVKLQDFQIAPGTFVPGPLIACATNRDMVTGEFTQIKREVPT